MQDTLASRATVGEFASFITAMLMLLAPVKHLSEINNALQRGLAAAESVFALVDSPIEDDRGTVTLGRAKGELEFENVASSTRSAPSRARRYRPAHPARRNRRVGRRLGRGQDHAGQPAAAVLCAQLRPRAARRPRPAEPHARQPARQHCARQPGDRAVQRLDLRQHRLRRHGRRGGEGRHRRGGGRTPWPSSARRPRGSTR